MLKSLFALATGALIALPALAQQAEVTLTRLDCGSGTNDPRRFSDTFAYTETTKPFTFSCYVISHGSDHMVWDTGYLPGSVPNATNKPLADLLKQIHVDPEQVKYVGISHFHADHTGQLAAFKNATLLIGQRDWDGINANPPMAGANVKGFSEWISEKRKVEPQSADKDVFGDGSVMMLRAPGHTPGQRIKEIQKNLKATVIIQHDPRDIGKLPAFPAAAK
jgi:glyoxylase-like metal-dependent hydrolase (beta-lactamase superfamily II)